MPFSVLTMIAVVLMSLQKPEPAPPGAFRSLDRGLDTNVTSTRQVVVRTESEWETLWREHAVERPRPRVNFNQEMVVAIFMGSRPTAGFAVEVVMLREEAGALVVQYRETRPAAGALTAQVLTMPYHIVAVPLRPPSTTVKFEKIN
jgi:hypothetical protein